MPNFSYVGVDDNGMEVRGIAAADNEDQLADLLKRQGPYLVRSSTAGDSEGHFGAIRILEWLSRGASI